MDVAQAQNAPVRLSTKGPTLGEKITQALGDDETLMTEENKLQFDRCLTDMELQVHRHQDELETMELFEQERRDEEGPGRLDMVHQEMAHRNRKGISNNLEKVEQLRRMGEPRYSQIWIPHKASSKTEWPGKNLPSLHKELKEKLMSDLE